MTRATARACRKQLKVVSDTIPGFTLRQLRQQHPGYLQVGRVKAFGEPAVDGRDQVSGFIPFALLLPQRV